MNPTLAQIYGTEKVASTEEFDLNSISGAELLELMEMEEAEKNASENFDLNSISGAELLELMEMEEEGTLEKMASDGSFDYYDNAGRIMAHAYADEMSKVAGDYSDELDLNSISGAELLELMEMGDAEKTAAPFMGPLRRFRGGKRAGKLTKFQLEELKAFSKANKPVFNRPDRGHAAVKAYHAKSMKRPAPGILRQVRNKITDADTLSGARADMRMRYAISRDKHPNAWKNAERGAIGAGVVGLGAGGYHMYNKRK